MSVNSKAIKVIGQRKPFYWQRIPGSSCVSKETIDVDIIVASKNGNRIMIRPPLRIKKWDRLTQLKYLQERIELATF